MRGKSGPKNPSWKGDSAQDNAKRERARRLYRLAACEVCGAKATDRHHRDTNTGNNHPSNIQKLCRRCHMLIDGRLESFVTSASAPKLVSPPKPCINCERPSKPLRRGRCGTCDRYLARYGKERPYKVDGRVEKTKNTDHERPCLKCGRPSNWGKHPTAGYCGSCYQIVWRSRQRAS